MRDANKRANWLTLMNGNQWRRAGTIPCVQRQHLVAVKYCKFRGTATAQKGEFRGKLRQNLPNFAAKFVEFRGKLRQNLSNFAASCGKS